MEKTNMAETVREHFSPRKKRLLLAENDGSSASIEAVRDPQNPVKVRAENRARELGMTLGEIYQRTGVSRNYLTYYPKNGWREDRVRLVANELQWTVDELLYGPQYEREAAQAQSERARREDDMLDLAIEIAVELLAQDGPDATRNGPNVGRLSRMILEYLKQHHGVGEQPSRQSLRIFGRLLITAFRDRSTGS